MGAGHDGARNGQISEQGHVIGQHGLSLMLEVLEGVNRIAQIDRDALPDVVANAALYQKKAGGGECSGNQQHREQKARAQTQSR
jgi:GTPase involved in cell partitioning and DNA repair